MLMEKNPKKRIRCEEALMNDWIIKSHIKPDV